MSGRAQNANWVVWFALLPALLTPTLMALSRHDGAAFRMFVVRWHGAIEGLFLVGAGAALVAAIVAGVVTWRRVSRHA
jgi:hypothetical protein